MNNRKYLKKNGQLPHIKCNIYQIKLQIFPSGKIDYCTNEELVSKTSYIHPDLLLIYIIDFFLQLK